MIICFNCDAITKQQMDLLLEKGEYKDYTELVTVAISNLSVISKEFHKTKEMIINKSTRSTKGGNGTQLKSEKPLHDLSIPNLFLNKDLKIETPKAAEVVNQEKSYESFTIDQWLFGQFNKLLPLKVNCRALSRLMSEFGNRVPLKNAFNRIVNDASVFGDFLSEHDRLHKIGRTEALATAFPRQGKDAGKSRLRYETQFLGSVNSKGELYGMMHDYKFIILKTNEQQPAVQLTIPGLEFARLPNPVLDSQQDNPTQKFLKEEIVFLLNHIKQYVPSEYFAFTVLLSNIRDGANTPNKLDETLQHLIPDEKKKSLSESFISSQRSGALSRMTDLSLIVRISQGIKVLYDLTEQGHMFIN